MSIHSSGDIHLGGQYSSDTDVTDVEKDAVRNERARREAEQRATDLADWRRMAREYLAGGQSCPPTHEANVPAGVVEAEVAEVKTEIARRDAEKRAAAENERIAATCARREFLVAHGAPEDMIERLDANALPEGELVEFVRNEILPAPLAGTEAYVSRNPDDIEHDDDCNGERDRDGDIVVFSIADVENPTLTSTQWSALKGLRAAAEAIGARVIVCKHTARMVCSCPNQSWLSAKLVANPSGLKMEIVRRYALA